jgi:type IV pilus assembly protein PilY1
VFPTATNRWRAWIGSGPESSDGKARLFDLRLSDGVQGSATVLDAAGTDDWTTEVAMIDTDSDRRVDRLYAGTQGGNLYRQRLDTSTHPLQLVFSAGAESPLSARPVLAFSELTPGDAGVIAYFGTGRLEEVDDRTDDSLQRLFAVRDPSDQVSVQPTTTALVTLADLLDLTDVREEVNAFPGDGWYVDLKLDEYGEPGGSESEQGARILDPPLLLNGVLFQTVFTPSENVCDFGGEAVLLALDMRTGNPPATPAMDLDRDGDIDGDDVRGDAVPRALVLGNGMPSRPVLDAERQSVVVQTSDTTLHTTRVRPTAGPVQANVWKVVGP